MKKMSTFQPSNHISSCEHDVAKFIFNMFKLLEVLTLTHVFFIIIYSNETNKCKILKFIQRSIQKKYICKFKISHQGVKNVIENTIFQKNQLLFLIIVILNSRPSSKP
jgi:hypothetical protein